MSLEERMVLKSIEIVCDAGDKNLGNVNVAWEKQIVRGDEVIHSSEHRGAYPLNKNGEPDKNVTSLMGSSISSILGISLSQSQYKISELERSISERDLLIEKLKEKIAELINRINKNE